MKKYFSYTEGFTNNLPNITITNYLQIEKCEHTSKEVISLHTISLDFPLHLHSENELDTYKSVELFKNEDIDFYKYLDFYCKDNPKFIELFNKLKSLTSK